MAQRLVSILLEWGFLRLMSLVSLVLGCSEYDGCKDGNGDGSISGSDGGYGGDDICIVMVNSIKIGVAGVGSRDVSVVIGGLCKRYCCRHPEEFIELWERFNKNWKSFNIIIFSNATKRGLIK